MPHADEVLADAPAADAGPHRPSSPRLVRALLLGAGALAMVGLAVPDAAPQDVLATVTVTPVAAYTPVVEVTTVAPSPVALAPAPRVAPKKKTVAKRASRTRPAAKKTVSAGWFRPCSAGIGSYYGMRWGRPHKGLDFNGSTGDAIRAVGAGTVVGSGYLSGESGYGLITIIRHSNGYYSAYAHQSKSYVDSGDRVDAGETIGAIGSTGHSTGSHLHFEIRTAAHGGQVNPLTWLREHGVSI